MRRQTIQESNLLPRRKLQERPAAGTLKRLKRPSPFLLFLSRTVGYYQVDVKAHPRGMCARRPFVRRQDHLRDVVDQAILVLGKELKPVLLRGSANLRSMVLECLQIRRSSARAKECEYRAAIEAHAISPFFILSAM